MASSGTINYTVTRDTVIKYSLMLLRIIGSEQTVNAADNAVANDFLNMLVKMWQARGLELWATQEAALFPQLAQVQYQLGANNGAGGDNASNTYVLTDLNGAALVNATSLVLGSVTGMTVGDNIGINVNTVGGNTRFWTTIATITPATKTVTINAGLSSAASDEATVITYTTALSRPLEIYSMRRYNMQGATDIPLERVSRQVYFDIVNKTSIGTSLQYFYDPQLLAGQLYMWEPTATIDDILKFTYLRSLQDFDLSTNTPDFPQEWYLPLIYGLAVCLAPIYGKKADLQTLEPMAEQYLKIALDWDNERTLVSVQPSMKGRMM